MFTTLDEAGTHLITQQDQECLMENAMKDLNRQEVIPLNPPVVDIGHPEDRLFKTADPDVPILITNDGFPLGYTRSSEDADPVAIYRELNQLSAVPSALITPKRRHRPSLAGEPYPATVR